MLAAPLRLSQASWRVNRQGVLHVGRIVGNDLRVDAVLERRDDVAAVGVVLRVGREHHADVERDAQRKAADLEVLLLEDVEQPHLDARRQVGHLVDGEDAAVGARHDAVVDHALVGVGQALGGGLDRIDVADQVSDGNVRRSQLLLVALLRLEPADRGVAAVLGDDPAALRGDRPERVLVQVGAVDGGDVPVEKPDQGAQNARLGLSAQPEQDKVVPRQDGVHQPGQHGLLIAEDAGKQVADLGPVAQHAHQVVAHLLLDGAIRGVAEGAQRLQGPRQRFGTRSIR